MMKNVVTAFALALFGLSACGNTGNDFSAKQIASLSAKQKKTRMLQLALRHYDYYEGDITAELDRKTYAAMTLYSIDLREKQRDPSQGEITDAEINKIISDYSLDMKRLEIERKRAFERSSSSKASASSASSSNVSSSSSSSSTSSSSSSRQWSN